MQVPDLYLIFLKPLNRLNIPYMVTGSTAAMIYGMPRVTHDIDLVVQLQLTNINSLRNQFPEERFYIPPEEILRIEINRRHRGQFNIIDQETGFKADIYLSGQDKLHSWAFTRKIQYTVENELIWIAPLEYIILRKLEYYKEGGSNKHLEDIRNMIEVSGTKIDNNILSEKISYLGLQHEWQLVSGK
jgi:hypothetical protein